MRQPWIKGAFFGLVMIAAILLLPSGAAAASYRVTINGVLVSDTLAEIRDGQMMVAVRPYAEAMGAWVEWDDAAKRVTLGRNGTQIAFWLGSHTVFQDGRQLWSPVRPYLKQGRTMVPAWFLAVRLGGKVSFDGITLAVTITKAAATKPNHVLAQPSYYFPFPSSATYQPYSDTMGAYRSWGGQSYGHEGTDIVAPRGTPVVAVASGTVIRYGWNTLGGYRVTVRLDDFPNYSFYYAHLDRYAPNIYLGAHVKAGQVLGYVGSTGEGPEGTRGKFVDHLHFGIYDANWNAINPYPLLKYWENHKVSW
ncbi:MAG TPA: peptidoglycan DD-metalloendopeptidase family protein [Symbiobacteriaceae bacterium]